MKRLILIRHAKSSWETALNDKDRPLSNRGVQDAHLMAEKTQKLLPESYIIWSSTAKRALETARIFAQHLGYPEELIVKKEGLYTFDENQLEREIKSCDNSYDNLIVFGHNSAVTDFVNSFGNTYLENVCTCGFVSFVFEQDQWDAIRNGKIQKIIFPKDFKSKPLDLE